MTTPRTPRAPGVRWWHKWIGVAIGLLLVVWVLSGLLMILPASAVARRGQGDAPIDWTRVTVSPAQAVQAAAALHAGAVAQRVEVKRVRRTVAYLVTLGQGRRALLDAVTAAPIRITAELAGEMALEGLPGVRVARVEKAGRRWHVFLDDAKGTEAFVGEETGDVVRSQRFDRMKASLGHDLHVLMPFKALPGGDRTRLAALWITGIIALVSIVTGYWLAHTHDVREAAQAFIEKRRPDFTGS